MRAARLQHETREQEAYAVRERMSAEFRSEEIGVDLDMQRDPADLRDEKARKTDLEGILNSDNVETFRVQRMRKAFHP